MSGEGHARSGPVAAGVSSSAATDTALIDAFLHGDAAAAGQIQGWAARICRLRGWRLHRHDDLVQDVMVELVTVLAAGRFQGRSSLQTFVERVAKYRCIDALRRERDRRFVAWDEHGEPEAAAHDNPERRLAAREEIRLCHAVLSRLPDGCRDLLRRLLADDARYEDLAAEFDVAPGTIKSRVARCRERAGALRERLLREPGAWREGADR